MSRLKKRSVLQKIADAAQGSRGGAPKKRKKPYTKRAFNIDDDLWQEVEMLAKDQNMTITEIIQKALRSYLKHL